MPRIYIVVRKYRVTSLRSGADIGTWSAARGALHGHGLVGNTITSTPLTLPLIQFADHDAVDSCNFASSTKRTSHSYTDGQKRVLKQSPYIDPTAAASSSRPVPP